MMSSHNLSFPQGWKSSGKVARNLDGRFLKFMFDKDASDQKQCSSDASISTSGNQDKGDEAPAPSTSAGRASDPVAASLSAMSVQPIFPTLITTVNVRTHMGSAFADRLADMAISKYTSFSQQRKAGGESDPNDINDAFFSAQSTSVEGRKSRQAQKFWAELYNSKEYQQLGRLMRGALLEHASKTGYPVSPVEEKEARVVLWAEPVNFGSFRPLDSKRK